MAALIVNLECITNMHVGNGDVNYNVIDNEVERDVVTGYPTIHASGVKGALREYFVRSGIGKELIKDIFGEEYAGKTTAGKLRILNADMLAMPVRASAGANAYYMITTQNAIEKYKEKCELFLCEEFEMNIFDVKDSRQAEGINLEEAVCIAKKGFLEKELHIISDEEFRKISLPVLARNKLNNGKSENLWYEEVVPHKSLFSFSVLSEDIDKELLASFKNTIDDKIVQFGGNASIGYGLCKVSVVEV